jgi:hypothetical protein
MPPEFSAMSRNPYIVSANFGFQNLRDEILISYFDGHEILPTNEQGLSFAVISFMGTNSF